MNVLGKVAVCTSLLFLANGIRAQTPGGVPGFTITKDDSSIRFGVTGPNSFEVDGNFTIRGVTRAEKLTLTASDEGTGSGAIVGTMAFDRKEFGMNSGIPFIRIAERVEVSGDLKAKRVSGPPLVFKK